MTPIAPSRAAFLKAIGSLGRAPANVYRPCVPCCRMNPRKFASRPSASSFSRHLAMTVCSMILMVLLDDTDDRVQRHAMDAIRALGPLGRKALPVVIGKLNSPDPEVRLASAELIGSHGQAAAEAVPALTALLDDPSPKIQTIAAETLGNLGKAAQPAFTRLAALLGAKQVEVREAAAVDAGKPGTRRGSRSDPISPGHSGTTRPKSAVPPRGPFNDWAPRRPSSFQTSS